MKLRRPYTTASMWSSGKITCTGANSEDQAKVAARKYARLLQKLGFNCRFNNYRVVNVLGTCIMPFAIKITNFSKEHREARYVNVDTVNYIVTWCLTRNKYYIQCNYKISSYEPELHPGVTYRIKQPKATLKIFSTGSITITAPSVANIQSAVEHIYPLVYPFQKPKTQSDVRLGTNAKELLAISKVESSTSGGELPKNGRSKGIGKKRKRDDRDSASENEKSDTSTDSD